MGKKIKQQKYIKQLFARYGYKDVEFEHCHSPLSGLSVPIRRALRDQVMGIERTSDGH